MRKASLLTFLFLLLCLSGYSQFGLRNQASKYSPPDSVDISYYGKKKGWKAAGMNFTLNMSIWAFDRYVLDAEYAYIGTNSIKKNFKTGFVWDNDKMGTNMFFHPYNGNLYYNSARSNGYNFWASGLFALGGSAMWELFMENESPSINDIIATPIGGMAIGEVFYRSSDMLIDDRKRGWERFGREFGVFLITPTRSLSRILSGDAWRIRRTSGKQFGTPMLSADFSLGVRILELKDEIFDQGIGLTSEITIEYGDKFNHDNPKPYDFFSFRANLNVQKSQPIIGQVNIIGLLWGKGFEIKNHYLGIGFYQHFDYYDSDTISDLAAKIPYKFGTPASLGIGFYHKRKVPDNWSLDSYGHLNALLVGASLSDHYTVDNRNYNLVNGAGWKLGFNLAYKDKIGFSFLYEGYWMRTSQGYPEGYDLTKAMQNELNAQGDKSTALINTIGLILDVKLCKKLYLTTSFNAYIRETNYDYDSFPNVYSESTDVKVMLTYKL